MANRSRVAGVGTVLLGAALLVGCGRSKIAQCNRLIEVANAQETQLSAQVNQMNAASGDPAQIDALAAAFEHSAQQIAAVRITDPQLSALSHEYQSVITRFVTIARAMAAAARAQNVDGINQAIPQLQQIETQSTTVVTRINRYCQSL